MNFVIPMYIGKNTTLTYQDIIKATVENENTLILFSGGLSLIKAPVLGLNYPQLDPRLLRAKGYSVEFLPHRSEYNALTDSYWTCRCTHDFVWHKALFTCPNCGAQQGTINRLPYIEEVYGKLEWKFLVE